jgi:predicted alpha/beta-fold hydrolase
LTKIIFIYKNKLGYGVCMEFELPFNPCPIIAGKHRQTIIGSILFSWEKEPISLTELVSLPDNDKIAIEITTPKKWKNTDITVVMVHGLCGSHRSCYLVRMAKKLEEQNIKSIRVNLRGCGSGKGLAKGIFHAGQSNDVFEAIKIIKKTNPASPIILIGFSMGGNIVLKLVGELNTHAKDYLYSVIAVNPPVKIYSSVKLIMRPENKMYERYFLNLLQEDIDYRKKLFPNIFSSLILPKNLNFEKFDKLYTAPYGGFESNLQYYNECSSYHLLSKIKIPCKILFSKDDPIINYKDLKGLILPSNIDTYITQKGGHLGYLSHVAKGKFHWLDKQLLEWISSF